MKILLILFLTTVSYPQVILMMSANVDLRGLNYSNLNSFTVDLSATSKKSDSVAFFLDDAWITSFEDAGSFAYTKTGLTDTTAYTFKAIAYGEDKVTKRLTFVTYTGFYFITVAGDSLKTTGNYFRTSRY